MKKLIPFIILLVFSTGAYAAPFLVSDPYGPCGEPGQDACPVSATIYQDGVAIATDIALQTDLSILHDLETMPTGEHNYTAAYKDELGRPSDPSDPYLLLRQGHAPLNLRARP